MFENYSAKELKYFIEYSNNPLAKALLKHYYDLERQLADRDLDFLEGFTTETTGEPHEK